MSHLLAKLSNPLLVHILTYIGKENESNLCFCPLFIALIVMFCVCEAWYGINSNLNGIFAYNLIETL